MERQKAAKERPPYVDGDPAFSNRFDKGPLWLKRSALEGGGIAIEIKVSGLVAGLHFGIAALGAAALASGIAYGAGEGYFAFAEAGHFAFAALLAFVGFASGMTAWKALFALRGRSAIEAGPSGLRYVRSMGSRILTRIEFGPGVSMALDQLSYGKKRAVLHFIDGDSRLALGDKRREEYLCAIGAPYLAYIRDAAAGAIGEGATRLAGP
jgi:hypothetical protein